MIEKGKEWGAPTQLRGDEPLAHDDAQLAALLDAHPGVRVLLDGGDLYTSLGGQAPPEPYELPLDLLEVTADGTRYVAVSHVIARQRWWSGFAVVAMNGTHLGGWNLGPKAHPNDGLVDVTFGSLSLSDRLKARKRAPLGAHLPHPQLTLARKRSWSRDFDRSTPLYIDGVAVGAVRHIDIVVHPDVGSVILANPTTPSR